MKNYCALLLLLLLSFPLNAQNGNTLLDSYNDFKQEAWKEYEDFRLQCNLEYAEFMKQAWAEYGAKPPVAVPVEKKVPVLVFDAKKMRSTGNLQVAVEEAPMIPMDVVQPVPLCKIPETRTTDFSKISLNVDAKIGEEALRQLFPQMNVKKHKGGFLFSKKKGYKEKKLPQKATETIVAENVQADVAEEVQPDETEEEAFEPSFSDLKFTFFGTEMKVRVLDDFKYSLLDCEGETLSNAWKLLSSPRFNNTIRDCLELRYDYNMCDWAYVEMLQSMANAYLGEDTNEAVFFAAYIYCQSGYQMRLARNGNKLYMLVASKHFMYDHSFFVIDGQEYFTLVKVGNDVTMSVCNTNFKNESGLSLFMPRNVSFADDFSDERTIKSTMFDEMSMTVRVNRNLLQFYEKYPVSEVNNNFMTRWAMYANTPLDKNVKEQIYPHLKRGLEGHTPYERVHMLMHMLQTGLEYGYDDEVWGGDRAFFAEETLYYPLCDCEDRSILLSHFVRELCGLKVLLVFFPGHLLTAVHFDEEVEGNYCMYEGEKYVFCDPTYRGAPIGRIYPEYEHEKPTVILLKN